MGLAGVVDVVDYGSDSCCFADPGAAAGQNQAGLDFGDFMQRGMEVELFDRRNMPGKKSNGHADPSRRGKEVDSKTGGAHGYSVIIRFLLPKHIELFGGQQRSDKVIDFLMRPAYVGVKLDDTILP